MTEVFDKWIAVSPTASLMIFISSVTVYVAILAYTRMAGLRSFSKMSSADFAMTIAVGSLFGATISAPSPTLLMGLLALLCVFAGQWALAWLRRRSSIVGGLVDNQPLLLARGRILDDHLRFANMTRDDLFGKLREANAFRLDQVIAVIFESTGDVSVIHDNEVGKTIDLEIFDNVVGHELLRND